VLSWSGLEAHEGQAAFNMRRRELITLLGGAAIAWPLAARAQQPAMPVIGYLSSRSPDDTRHLLAAFLRGLNEAGYVEGQNVTIECRRGDEGSDLGHAGDRCAHAREPGGGLILMPEAFLNVHRVEVISLAARHRLPAVYSYRFFAELGGLLSYGNDPFDNFRRAASYADRILRGEKPSELPVQAPVKFKLVVNLKTAKALALDVPPLLQQRADEVIE
jgi:ABC transporter substrate binding protein